MPKLSSTLPKYRRHRASGQAIVTLSGRDHYLGPHNTAASKRLYDRLIAEWLQRDRRSSPTDAADQITVTTLCARYLRFAQSYYLKDGECTRVVPGIKCAIKYLRLWYGATSAADFGPLALKAVRQQMIDDGLSRKYINDHVARIKRIWKWGVGEQLVSASEQRRNSCYEESGDSHADKKIRQAKPPSRRSLGRNCKRTRDNDE